MTECGKIRNLMISMIEGLPDPQTQEDVDRHIAVCTTCREEAAAIGLIHQWLQDQELFAPEQDFSWQCLPRTLAAKATQERSFKSWLPFNMGTIGWVANLAAVLFLGVGILWFSNRSTPPPDVKVAIAPPENQAFLERMQLVYARAATVQYLSDCQELLLNVMRAGRNCEGDKLDVSLEVLQARSLLDQKRLLDQELSQPQVACAKELCDELEGFLINLSTSEKCESPDSLHRLEHFIQKEQLLLRINVLQSELS